MTEASQSVPISYGLIPSEGPRSILLNFDLTVVDKQSLKVTLAQHGIATIQTIFIDNGTNALPCSVVFKLTNQQISVAPFRQGFFPVAFPKGDIDLEVSTLGSVFINVMLLNIPVPPVSYSTSEPDISFVNIVNNPLIVNQLKTYFSTYSKLRTETTTLGTTPSLIIPSQPARTALDITASVANTNNVNIAPENDVNLKWIILSPGSRTRITDYRGDLYLWSGVASQKVSVIDWGVAPVPPPILAFTGSSSFDATNKKFGTHSVAAPIRDDTGNKLGSLPNERYWSFWARNNVSSPTTAQGIFIRGSSGSPAGNDIILYLDSTTLRLWKNLGISFEKDHDTSSVDWTLWQYFLVVFKTSATEVWLNGSLVLSISTTVGTSDRQLLIGEETIGWNVLINDWNGQIDEFAWFDGLPSDTTNIPSSAYTGLETNLRALAHFDNNLVNSGPNL